MSDNKDQSRNPGTSQNTPGHTPNATPNTDRSSTDAVKGDRDQADKGTDTKREGEEQRKGEPVARNGGNTPTSPDAKSGTDRNAADTTTSGTDKR